MRDYRAEAIAHLKDEYNAGEYAGQVLDFLLDYHIFTDTGESYLYDSEYFTIDKDIVKRIIQTIDNSEEV